MQIIGEKINSTLNSVGKAIAERDAEFIEKLAIQQTEAGADWLDLNAGTNPRDEAEDLVWLIRTTEKVTDLPFCLDSPNPEILEIAINTVSKTPIINSITLEPFRLEGILPLVAKHDCKVIALALDSKGRGSEDVGDRLRNVRQLIEETRRAGVSDDDVYVDAILTPIGINTKNGQIGIQTIDSIHTEFPNVHVSAGLSNVSFGLPGRSLLNRAFLTLALSAGLDCAIMDPLDRELMGAMLATQALLGRDPFCRSYTTSFKQGRIGPTP